MIMCPVLEHSLMATAPSSSSSSVDNVYTLCVSGGGGCTHEGYGNHESARGDGQTGLETMDVGRGGKKKLVVYSLPFSLSSPSD